jgi:hypothetical protein
MADKKPESTDAEARLEKLLTMFLEQGQKNQFTPEALGAILEKVGLSTAMGMQKAVRPENEVHPHISAFSYPEGDIKRPKPKLKRDTYYNFHKENEEQLTPAEIEAYNSIDQDYEARGGQFTAIIKQRGRAREELHLSVPVRHIDMRMNLPPSLLLFVHELKTGQTVTDMQDILTEITELRARLIQYEPETSPTRKTPSTSRLAGGGPLATDLEAALEATPTEALAR